MYNNINTVDMLEYIRPSLKIMINVLNKFVKQVECQQNCTIYSPNKSSFKLWPVCIGKLLLWGLNPFKPRNTIKLLAQHTLGTRFRNNIHLADILNKGLLCLTEFCKRFKLTKIWRYVLPFQMSLWTLNI